MGKSPERKGQYWVYILKCNDGTFYTGYTNNLANRVALHNSGRGAKYVRNKLPAVLVYAKEYRYYKSALNGEIAVKRLTRKRKEKLIRIYENNKQGECV
ncbi:MAG: GIY-YIG nuclease family protein [Planctomycetaceae bacterium]|nr:GIY-YIG nuclease family protein [Planctomycetaceae bacterium]